MPRILAKPVLIVICVVVLAATLTCAFLKGEAAKMDTRRKRDADAIAIRNALVAYRAEHDGRLPPSLEALELGGLGVDVSPFRLLPPGTRTGRKDEDVLVEGVAAGTSRLVIRIYNDSEARWEQPKEQANH